ncbi:MAG: hypothetical protein ACI94Y_001635 [Maribacter sp.]|jgi:hypothetical protein
MSDSSPAPFTPKSFWSRPEGKTGMFFGLAILAGLGYVIVANMAAITAFAFSTVQLAIIVMVLAAVLYMILDPRMRNLIWYGYKGIMRFVTGMFVQLDPIGVLKSYVDDLRDNLRKMSKQIGNLRGQMRRMKTIMQKNEKDINMNLKLAQQAQKKGNNKQLTLSTRKASRLKETNSKYAALHKKMEIMYKILAKMYENSEILLEDTKDQVAVKEQERKAIRASHSAMSSAMSIISGNGNKREMFDMALEAIADDVANKVGEMERFMDMSTNFMDSVDLENGVFEEEGMKMLEKWEKEGASLLLGDDKMKLLNEDSSTTLDLNAPSADKEIRGGGDNKYDSLFD